MAEAELKELNPQDKIMENTGSEDTSKEEAKQNTSRLIENVKYPFVCMGNQYCQ